MVSRRVRSREVDMLPSGGIKRYLADSQSWWPSENPDPSEVPVAQSTLVSCCLLPRVTLRHMARPLQTQAMSWLSLLCAICRKADDFLWSLDT